MEESRKADGAGRGSSEPSTGAAHVPKLKPYQSPELVEYGSVSKLTQGTLSMNADFFGGGFRITQMCL